MFHVGEVVWYTDAHGQLRPGEIVAVNPLTMRVNTYDVNPIDEIDLQTLTIREAQLTKHREISEQVKVCLSRRHQSRVKKLQNKFLHNEKKRQEKAQQLIRKLRRQCQTRQTREAKLFSLDHRRLAIKRLYRAIRGTRHISKKDAQAEAILYDKKLINQQIRFEDYWRAMKEYTVEQFTGQHKGEYDEDGETRVFVVPCWHESIIDSHADLL